MKKQLQLMCMEILLVCSCFFLGCASSQPINETVPADKIPGPGQSLITVQRSPTGAGGMIKMQIWLNNEEVAGSIERGVRTFLVVSNGEYAIQAGSSIVDRGNEIKFTVNNEEIIFMAEPSMGLLGARFNLKETGRKNF